MDLKYLKMALTAMLFASGEPVATEKLAAALNIEPQLVERLLAAAADDLDATGIEILRLENAYQMATRPAFAEEVEAIMDTRRGQPLSPAAMETLAIIAYNQPVSRAFIEQVRGVDSSSAVQTLDNRGLIEEAGRLDLPGRPISYRTTDTFLRSFGLASLANLPPLKREDAQSGENTRGGYNEEMFNLPGKEEASG